MATSFGALCTDFYINQKLAMKMDLPGDRETILHLFDSVRKSVPQMNRFRKFEGELALESTRSDPEYRWLAVWGNHVRTGHVNPESMAQGYKLQKLLLEVSPYHLTISPLDIDYIELTFGFDLECQGNHDEVVADALLADSPLAKLVQLGSSKVLDVQPVIGLAVDEKGNRQACFEVKTRRKSRKGKSGRYRDEPISILMSLRHYGPVENIDDLLPLFDDMAEQAEQLTTERLVPALLLPISRQIASSNA
jgi:hypothetical protein